MNIRYSLVLLLGCLPLLALAGENPASANVETNSANTQGQPKKNLNSKKDKISEKQTILLKMLVKGKKCPSWPECE